MNRLTSAIVLALLAMVPLAAAPAPVAAGTVDEPKYIWVCEDPASCSTTTVVVRFEPDYVKDVLNQEWICSWNIANTLNAGAIAVRTYGWYYVNHPRSSSFDIYGNSRDQNYVAGSSVTRTGVGPCNTAVTATAGKRVEYGGARIYAAYKAETGNKTGAGAQAYLPAVTDPHIASTSYHYVGMCAKGTLWYGQNATSYGSILAHYYVGTTLATGANYYVSESCSCTTTGCHRVEKWVDTSTNTTFNRSYSVGMCAV